MIISTVGSSNWKTRFAYGLIFTVLLLGSVTMIYPFLLMLSGSVKSDADSMDISPYPEFWFNDEVLLQKYVESKHNAHMDNCRFSWNTAAPSWRRLETPAAVDTAVSDDFRRWRETPEARDAGVLGHTSGARLLPRNARLWRKMIERQYHGDIQAYSQACGTMVSDWSGVMPPMEIIGRYRYPFPTAEAQTNFLSFKASCAPIDLFFLDSEIAFVQNYLISKYGREVSALNKAIGTSFTSWDDVRLNPHRVVGCNPSPALDPDREAFLRDSAPIQFIRLSDSSETVAAYRRYLVHRHGNIRAYNAMHRTDYPDFEAIPFVRMIDNDPSQRIEWEEFIRSREDCRGEWLEPYGPDESFLAFRRNICGRSEEVISQTPALGRIVAAVDVLDCRANHRALRKEFTIRNYLHVIDYIALHGNGILNTLIYCLLAIVTSVIVNPLAAYALSRFKLPGTYQILLFCMSTMAFPGEVSMIPAFILMKRFPLWPLAGAAVAMAVVYLLMSRFAPRVGEKAKILSAFCAALIVGGIVLPMALGPNRTTVSLLNTFAALILPGAGNGYFIFLLKGFFDSMPKELYEAAEIDGAGEWTKFWTLTINLSKPILAVIALGAFTGAYSAFMMALIIIPDQSMWTIMVWIFQLQSQSHGAVVYASIVLAAIPTFLVFAFCQNLIIRGIVVPTEK